MRKKSSGNLDELNLVVAISNLAVAINQLSSEITKLARFQIMFMKYLMEEEDEGGEDLFALPPEKKKKVEFERRVEIE